MSAKAIGSDHPKSAALPNRRDPLPAQPGTAWNTRGLLRSPRFVSHQRAHAPPRGGAHPLTWKGEDDAKTILLFVAIALMLAIVGYTRGRDTTQNGTR